MPTVTITTQPTYRLCGKAGVKTIGTIQAKDIEAKSNLLVDGNFEVAGYSYIPYLTKDCAVNSGINFSVSDDDRLRVGGRIIHNYELISYPFTATTADQWIFIADAAYEISQFEVVFTTASTSGTVDLKKSTTAQAPASGTSMLTGTVSLAGSANTVVAGTPHGTAATRRMADGDLISVCFGGDRTNLVGAVVTIRYARI